MERKDKYIVLTNYEMDQILSWNEEIIKVHISSPHVLFETGKLYKLKYNETTYVGKISEKRANLIIDNATKNEKTGRGGIIWDCSWIFVDWDNIPRKEKRVY